MGKLPRTRRPCISFGSPYVQAAHRPGKFADDYETQEWLDAGRPDRRILAVKAKGTGEPFVAKISHVGFNEKLTESEVASLRTFQHPNVIKMHAFYRQAGRTWLVLERALFSLERIIDNLVSLPLKTSCIAHILGSTLHALRYIHSFGFAHGDVKSLNLFVFYDGIIKLGFASSPPFVFLVA